MPIKLPIILLCLLTLTACASDEPYVMLEGERFYVDIADDIPEQTRGLMFVEEMPDNQGMLFVFPNMRPRSFWMKNTRIPLDIFYFDDDLELVSVAKNARPCRVSNCPSYPSTGPAQYVLELNAGKADELGAAAGSLLSLHNIP